MDINLRITADESALEFARLLSGFSLTVEPDPLPYQTPPAAGKSVTLEDCRALAKDVLSSDPERFKEAMVHFGIRKVPDLKPEQYGEFMEFLK